MAKTKTAPTKAAPATTKTPAQESSSPLAPNTQLKLSLKWTDVEPTYQKVVRQFVAKTKLAGFRLGKAPTPLVIDHVGAGKILETTLDRVLPDAYRQLIEKEKRQPLTSPDIHAESVTVGKDWELVVEIAEEPTIDVTGYEKVVKTAKKDAEKTWEDQQKTEAKAKKATAESADTPSETSGDQTKAHQDHVLKHVYQALIMSIKPALPELLVKMESRRELEDLVRSLERYQLSLEDYLQRRQQSFEDLSSEIATSVLAKWQLEFIVQAIVKTAKLEASQEDIAAFLNKPEQAELKKYAENPQYTSYISSLVTRQKLIDHLEQL